MKTDLNTQLRIEILDIALNLEQNVNTLLLVLLSIENPKRKAITNKSGNLSFKNKIDLLFDLDILNSNEHRSLLLLMEFRNQFLHNIECDSFEKAVRILGADKQKKLLNFDDLKDHKDKESQYKHAYRNLYSESLRICLEKIQDRRNQIEDRGNTHAKLIESQVFYLDKYFDIINKVVTVCENNISSNSEVVHLTNLINQTITNDMELTFASEEYNQLSNAHQELHLPEKNKELL